MFRRLVCNQKGGVIVLFALSLITLCAFAGMALDVGNFYVHHARLQNAVDAACLAGAAVLPDTDKATAAAEDYLQRNLTQNQDKLNPAPNSLQIAFENSNNRIDVTYTDFFPAYFLKVIPKFYGTNITVSAAAQAVQNGVGGAFGWTVFNGSKTTQLNMNGSTWNIDGSIHSNQNLNINGSHISVTGMAESVGTTSVSSSGSNSVGSQASGAKSLDMPDYYAQIKSEAVTAKTTNTIWNNGSNINVDGNVYVNGTSTFNGNTYTGTGAILAEGNITFNGNNVQTSANGQVCFYSESGDIRINGNGYTIDGILYAPHGRVIINGTNDTINGRIIANSVAINGSNLNVNGQDPVTSLPTDGTNSGHAQLVE